MREPSRPWILLAVVLAVLVLYAVRVLDSTLPPPAIMRGYDMNAQFFPSFVFLQRSVLSGELPLWNPHQFAGVPFLATHISLPLYPLLWIFIPLPAHLALVAHGFLHLALGAAFVWLLGRRLGLHWSGCAAAAFAFSLSGCVTGNLENAANLSTFAWLPALLWAIHGVAMRLRLRDVAALVLVIALSFLSGYSQGFLYSMQTGALYALFLLVGGETRGRRLRIARLLALAGVWALLLVAAQLLPAIELAQAGVRDLGGLSFEDASRDAVVPPIMRKALLGTTQGMTQLPVLFLPLALAALVLPRHRTHAIFFAGLFALAFEFMQGHMGAVFPIYFELPFGNLFRAPIRINFVYALAAAMLVGIGSSAIVASLSGRRRAATVVAVALPLLIAANQFARTQITARYDILVNPEALYGPEDFVRTAKRTAGYDRIFLETWFNLNVLHKLGTIHGMYVVPDYDPILPGAYGRYFGMNEMWHGDLDVSPPPGTLGEARKWMRTDPRLLDLLSVRYYADATTYYANLPHAEKQSVLGRVVNAEPVAAGAIPLFRRPESLPRAYIVHDVTEVANLEDALAAVRAGEFDPRTSVVVVGPVEELVPEHSGAREYARIESYTPQVVELEVHCEAACLAVLTDLFYPGWKVRVDGADAPILRVNFLVRGVRLEPGTHRVVYRYAPRSFRIGATLSAGALTALLGLGAFGLRSGWGSKPHRDRRDEDEQHGD